MRPDNGGPAFPRPASEYTKSGTLEDGNDAIDAQPGMSLRDWFAGMALPGLLSDKAGPSYEGVHVIAYKIADGMLKQREVKS